MPYLSRPVLSMPITHSLAVTLISSLTLTVLLSSQTARAEIYKWRDENGKLHYSSTPRVLAPNIQEIKLQTAPADRANARRQERLLNQKKRDIQRIERDKENTLAEQKVMLKQEARDKDMCEKYQQRYAAYQKEGIKGVNLTTGKTQKLTGAAARNALQGTKENVELFCH